MDARSSSVDFKHALEALPTMGKIDVSYSIGNRLCSVDGANVISITFLEKFGPLPPLTCEVVDSHVRNITNSVIEIQSSPLSVMSDGLQRVYSVVKGTKDNSECSNRGICNRNSGMCDCFVEAEGSYGPSDGYGNIGQRDDCGSVSSSVSNCPSSCNDHGSCDESTYTCQCQSGFHGPDCSLRECPKALSWFTDPSLAYLSPLSNFFYDMFYNECSDMGVCNRYTGVCECRLGFGGAACEHMLCIGTQSGRTSKCSGHGQCLSLKQLAQHNKLNGNSYPIAYGSNPLAWDADTIFGCHCDDGYEGFDCSVITY